MRQLTSLLSRLLRRPGERDVATHQVAQRPEEVTEYWTDERLRSARPREQRIEPPDRGQ